MYLENIGTIKVLEVTDNADGSANVVFDISDEFKKNFIKAMNWKRWSNKKFSAYVVESLERYIEEREQKNECDG